MSINKIWLSENNADLLFVLMVSLQLLTFLLALIGLIALISSGYRHLKMCQESQRKIQAKRQQMSKEWSEGVKIFGRIEVIFGLSSILVFLLSLVGLRFSTSGDSPLQGLGFIYLMYFSSPLIMLFPLGLGMLAFKPLARKINLIVFPAVAFLVYLIPPYIFIRDAFAYGWQELKPSGFGLLDVICAIIFLLPFITTIPVIHYLTRPKVKEQFQ